MAIPDDHDAYHGITGVVFKGGSRFRSQRDFRVILDPFQVGVLRRDIQVRREMPSCFLDQLFILVSYGNRGCSGCCQSCGVSQAVADGDLPGCDRLDVCLVLRGREGDGSAAPGKLGD